jgi:purine nucleosidase
MLLAFASEKEIDLLAVTTVAGNVPEASTTRNALRICALAGRAAVPVYAGCPRPLMRRTREGASVHGEDGLGDIGLADTELKTRKDHAVDFIIDAVNAEPGEITLCVIGPMTNIAVALVKAPAIAPKIKQIVFMGGAVDHPGNTTATAEFNIWFDPHAASIVASAGIPMTMFGLDVTSQAIITPQWLEQLRSRTGRLGSAAVDMLVQYHSGDPWLHDPCVIAYLIDPTLFSGRQIAVCVCTEQGPDYGRTASAADATPVNCFMVETVDSARFFDLLLGRITDLDRTLATKAGEISK